MFLILVVLRFGTAMAVIDEFLIMGGFNRALLARAPDLETMGYVQLFESAGVELIDPSCGACIKAGPGVSDRPDQVTVSAINRNFAGRGGPGQVWLTSPPTVVASAIAGRITSFDALAEDSASGAG